MYGQVHNSCLVNMPELVLDKILSNIHNPSNVSRTCKYLYEIVCGTEKRRCVMYISTIGATTRLNIDTDAVFESIINSHRTIKEIELRVSRSFSDKFDSAYEFSDRQLERISDIMKQFGANVTSLKFPECVLPVNFILELLQLAPKLESISYINCKVKGSVSENVTKSQLSSLKSLEIIRFFGLLDIVNLIPAGSLKVYSHFISCFDTSTLSTEAVNTILRKQHNIKSLTLEPRLNSDLANLSVDHLQLEVLTIGMCDVEFLKRQTNLKELRLIDYSGLSGSLFQWICNNLKKLEVFEVRRLDSSIEGNAFEMLDKLKKLRHFVISDGGRLFHDGFQLYQFKSDSIEKFEIGFRPEFSCGELLTKVVGSIAHNLPNLTHLQMAFKNFSAFCFVLGHCTQIIHLTSYINYPIPDQLTDQHFPNIQNLQLHNEDLIDREKMSQTMTLIVRAMPTLKCMSLTNGRGLKFDAKMMNEFIKESKNLEYFHVNHFQLSRELSTDDVVETVRLLVDPLKGCRIKFSPSESMEDLNFHKIKDILSIEYYVRDDYRNPPSFNLCKGEENKF